MAPIFSHPVLKHILEDYPSSAPFPPPITYPTLQSVVPWTLNLLLLTAQALPNAGGTACPQLFILFCQIPGPGLTVPKKAQAEEAARGGAGLGFEPWFSLALPALQGAAVGNSGRLAERQHLSTDRKSRDLKGCGMCHSLQPVSTGYLGSWCTLAVRVTLGARPSPLPFMPCTQGKSVSMSVTSAELSHVGSSAPCAAQHL